MPRKSNKVKLMKMYEEIACYDVLMLEAFGEDDVAQSKKVDKILEELTLVMAVAENSRYGVPFVHHSVPKSQHFITDILPNLDENRFRQITRVSWTNFKLILDLIKDDEVFHGPQSSLQFPVEMQLIIILYRLGSSGEGATVAKIARFFGIGDGGTLQIITERIFKVILKFRHKFLYWPDDSERKNLVAETFHELPHCIGYVDGTEIKLAEKPTEDPEAYFSRKHVYSLKVQAVCDYKLRIRHMVLGYPGSVHDARIYKNCGLSTKAHDFLNGAEWIAGDSAYKLTGSVITPYRENSSEGTLEERNDFNKTFCRYRIRIEHCFGLLKERFNSLKELKVQIKNDSSIKLSCRWILVCAILHNIVLIQGEKENDFEVSNEPLNDDENDEAGNLNDNQNYPTVAGELKLRMVLEIIKDINV